MPGIYAILSNHGFGHLSRSASILSEFQEIRPDLRLMVASIQTESVVRALFRPGFELRSVALDPGVVSSDSLSFDPSATFKKIKDFRRQEDDLVRSEAASIRDRGLDLVISDISPLATRIARKAGVPCWMWGNFGWDEIYRHWGGELNEAADRAAEMYADCDLLFRLPFHMPMAAFPERIDVGVTGRPTRLDPVEVRRRLGLDERPIVLLALGGLGLEKVPFANAADFPEFQFVSFVPAAMKLDNLHVVRDEELQPRDMLPLCDRILSKPGYGMFCEILHNPAPFYCLDRKGWAEAPVLLEALRNYHHHRVVAPEEFLGSSWDFLRQDPHPPRKPALALNGNDTILKYIKSFFG